MKVLLDDVVAGPDGCWLASVPPHQLAKLNAPLTTRGIASVLLAEALFDPNKKQLSLDAESVVVLNLGTTTRTFVIDSALHPDAGQASSNESEASLIELGRGDREFLGLVERELRGEAQEAAVDLLREVRQRWPGDLHRGERNNFSNTPDNFWYAIVQPRVQALSITIRGAPNRFHSESLELRVDRPGYTRFTVRSPDDVPEALRLIGQSKRR